MWIPLLYCTAIIFLFSAISVWPHFHSWEMYFLREHLSVCREKFGSRSAFATKQKGIHYCAWHTSVLCTASSRRLNIPHNDNWDGMTFFSTSKHVSPTHILGDNDLWYLFRLSLPLERADNMQRRRTFERFLSATLFPFQHGPLYHAECQPPRCRDAASLDACVRACVWKRVRYAKWGPPRNKTGLLLCAPPTKRKDGFKVSRLIDIKLEWAASDEKNARTHTQAGIHRDKT
jgi:hypothetical protein